MDLPPPPGISGSGIGKRLLSWTARYPSEVLLVGPLASQQFGAFRGRETAADLTLPPLRWVDNDLNLPGNPRKHLGAPFEEQLDGDPWPECCL